MRLPFIVSLLTALTPVVAEDVLHLTDGRVFHGSIRNLASSQIQMEVKLPGVSGSAQRSFETHAVDFIDFAPLPGETEALADPSNPAMQDRLFEFWRQKSVRLAWPTNNAGQIGLAYADGLLDSRDPDLIDRAFRIYSLIEKDDWDAARRALAQRGRLRALIRLGRVDEAIREAQQVARESEDPALVIEAQHVLAAAAFEKLKRFDQQHPRWDQDSDLEAERDGLYQETLDGFLHTPLFHGSVETPSAAALWQVVQVHLYMKEPALALAHAQDILHLYPQMPEAQPAKKLLTTLAPDAPAPAPSSPASPE